MTRLDVTRPRRDPLAVRGADLYETPPEAVHALLAAVALPPVIWEPACGPGAITRVLRGAGHTVIATDLVDYASPDQDSAGIDFLLERAAPAGTQAIVTNPPFSRDDEFVRHALRLCPHVVLLLRLACLEGQERVDVMEGGRLALVLPFADRVPRMHRAGWSGRRASGTTAFAWFCWDRDHRGDTAVRRIWCKPEKRLRQLRRAAP